MVQLSGKYKLVENKNFYEFLIGVGESEERAKEGNAVKGTLEVKIDGNKISMTNDTPAHVSNLVAGEERDEKFGEYVVKSKATIDGNVLTVTSKTPEGQPAGSRTLTFSDSGLEIVISSAKDGKTYSATRIYKRV
ncbi:fatty acid-binding protein homolog 5-like [Anoplophora glabripennis]|uniref:fatty acid-binding protein homolog 5-like n=1 Tax=Anoplophora glabripennis TaxID=217634 RepID=UPI0008757A3C|nr:fatty acid-binding protein homolog 5-like [Anoplophora glabripennis]